MKKILLFDPVLLLASSGCNLFNSEQDPRDVSVSEAKKLGDGAYVRIIGAIEEYLFGEWYTLKDNTGTIIIEIESEEWKRSGINPASLTFPVRFEIIGEIDKEFSLKTVVEVESLKKL